MNKLTLLSVNLFIWFVYLFIYSNNSHLFVFHVNVLGSTAGARGGQHLHFASLLEHVNNYITAGGKQTKKLF